MPPPSRADAQGHGTVGPELVQVQHAADASLPDEAADLIPVGTAGIMIGVIHQVTRFVDARYIMAAIEHKTEHAGITLGSLEAA